MWVWEVVDEVGTYCLLINLGYYFVMIALLCYACRRGLVCEIHERCESYIKLRET